MLDWLTDPFASSEGQRALAASVLVAGTASLAGTWMVIRGLSFIGDALAHGVIPGIAVALLAGFDVTAGAAVGAALMVGGTHIVTRRTRLAEETGVGLLFVGMLALGVVIASRAELDAEELEEVLFGDVLGVSGADLWLLVAAAAFALLVVTLLYRGFLVLSFNEEKADVLGLRPRVTHVALLMLVAAVVVASFRAVGALLVYGLLVGPPATAVLLVRRVPAMIATAAGLGALESVIGLVIGHHAGTAGGATVAAVAVTTFFVVLAGREVALRVQTRGLSGPSTEVSASRQRR